MVKPMAVVWDGLTLLFTLPSAHHRFDSGGWLEFFRSSDPGNSVLGLLSVCGGRMAWWEVACGEDPKVTSMKGRVSRVSHFIFPFTVAWL